METIILTFDKPAKIKGNIFASVINLEAENNALIEKTNLINEATHKKHSEILKELIGNLNRKLKVIDFEFKFYEGFFTLTYKNSHVRFPFSIKIDAISTKNVSRYTTYLGEYNIVISYNKPNRTLKNESYNWHNCNDIEVLEGKILSQIKSNKGLR